MMLGRRRLGLLSVTTMSGDAQAHVRENVTRVAPSLILLISKFWQ